MKKRKYLSIIIAQVAVVICLLMSPDVKALPQTGHAVTCPTCPTFGCMCIGNCLCWFLVHVAYSVYTSCRAYHECIDL